MKLVLLSCLVGILPYLVVSNPQITQSCSGAHCVQNNAGNPTGPVAQNCQESNCEQNNAVGRRKREIVAEILAEAVDAVGREERSAPAGHDHGGDHHHIPPVNVPHINIPPVHIPDVHIPDIHIRTPLIHIPDVHIPDVHIPDIHIPDVHVPHVQVPHVQVPHVPPPQHHQPSHHESPQHHESLQHHESPQHHKRSADPQISQSCSGSRCNQNNVLGSSTGFFPSIAQNCANGACNQNNVLNGRRKREVIAQLEEARKIAEEVEAEEEAISRRKRQISQNCVNGVCNQNNAASSGGHGAGVRFSGPAFQFPSIAQNCANGACNQNNVLPGRRKREVIAQLIEEARKIAEEEVEAEEAISRKKRQISQNCLNGLCNQNNVASGGHGAGVRFPVFQFPSISQNCANGACNQNNVLGRRKREIIAAILDESS